MRVRWILPCAILFLGLICSLNLPQTISAQNFMVDGDTIYVDDENCFISVTPHTVKVSQHINLTVLSKKYSGDIDVVFGFDTSQVKPKTVDIYKPHNVTEPQNMSRYFENATHYKVEYNYSSIDPPFVYDGSLQVYQNMTFLNGSGSEWILILEEHFEYANYLTKVVYCNETVMWRGVTENIDVDVVAYDFRGMNRWYKTVFAVDKNVSYTFRVYVEITSNLNKRGKYWVAFKPHAETLKEAISKGHFYYLDPWWASLVTFPVGDSNDDAHAKGDDTSFDLTNQRTLTKRSSTIEFNRDSGYRFPNITISQGTPITSATLRVYVNSSGGGAGGDDDMYATIFGNDIDNAQDFNDLSYIRTASERPRTTASLVWQEENIGVGWTEQNVTAIIQEIIDRAGWTSGNAMALLFISDLTTPAKFCHINSYDLDPDTSARLEISWFSVNVTFYLNQGGILRVNDITVANGSTRAYSANTTIELVAVVEGNMTFGFSNFSWMGSSLGALNGSSSDGVLIGYSVVDYPSARNKSTADFNYNTSSTISVGQNYADPIFFVYRAFLYFDTASIPDATAITGANITLFGVDNSSSTDFNITVQNGMPTYPSDPLQTTDYDMTFYSGTGGMFDTNNFVQGGTNTIVLNSLGISWINKTSTTKFCLRSDRDINYTAPSGLEHVSFNATETVDIQLVLTYDPISGYNISNPYNLTLTDDLTLWCYFGSIDAPAPAVLEFNATYYLLGAVTVGSGGTIMVIWRKRKNGRRV